MITALAAYLVGSIPTGFLAAKTKGIDIRTVGSGNMGATNVFRALGMVPGIFVLLVDALKGWFAVEVISKLAPQILSVSAPDDCLRIMAGVGAILGHNYTCWLKFKGGKGVATSAGVIAALVPWTLLIVLGLWIVLFVATRYVSVASIVAAFALPFATWFTTHYNVRLTVITAALGALAIYKHKTNLQRLLNGTENRIVIKTQALSPANQTSASLKVFGILLLTVGLAMAGYFFLVFDSSVASGLGRVVNLELMADRQNGIIVGIGLGVIGAIMFAIGSRNQK